LKIKQIYICAFGQCRLLFTWQRVPFLLIFFAILGEKVQSWIWFLSNVRPLSQVTRQRCLFWIFIQFNFRLSTCSLIYPNLIRILIDSTHKRFSIHQTRNLMYKRGTQTTSFPDKESPDMRFSIVGNTIFLGVINIR